MVSEVEIYNWIAYSVPVVIILVVMIWRRVRMGHNLRILKAAQRAGLTEPVSLHPVISPAECMGCGACIPACPEGNVLGLINGKAKLINATHCIGHGACRVACPFDAITLVFGTAKRGEDIPMVKENFETNVPGIYIAGELGGMGLIRNAVEQGRQAMENIASKTNKQNNRDYDVIIVGAGPAGFSATLLAHEKKMKYLTLEQDSLGGTVFKFPRGKVVMTAPVSLPIVGKVKFRETKKEALLDFWQQVEKKTGISIRYREKMDKLIPSGEGFKVVTSNGEYKTRTVLLAIGRRGTPRKLGVAGEDLSKVVYSLIDPEQYRNQHVLVVGGGDAALEAAVSISEQPGTTVTLSYRSESFSRAKEKNRLRVREAMEAGRIKILMSSNVKEIRQDDVFIEQDGKQHVFENQAVLICAGGILPTPFLKEIGIHVETKYGTA